METLAIKNTNTTITNNLVRIGDLVYFDGPLLTLFEDVSNGHLYLFDWVDRDNVYNRWFVYRVTPIALYSFISKQITHFDLFKSNPDNKFYTTDISVKYKMTDCDLSEIEHLPSDYLPIENYFDVADCPLLPKIKSFLERAISQTNQNNEYSPTETIWKRLTQNAKVINGFNKIYPSPYYVLSNHCSVEFSHQIEINYFNQYDLTSIFKSSVNLIQQDKKLNKIYA